MDINIHTISFVSKMCETPTLVDCHEEEGHLECIALLLCPAIALPRPPSELSGCQPGYSQCFLVSIM